MGKMVKSVEKLNINVAGVTTNSGILTKSQDTANCVPFGSYAANTGCTLWSQTMRDIYFSTTGSSGTLVLQRQSATSTIVTTTYVVEFDPAEVKIQNGTFNVPAASGSITISGTFTSVDTTRTAMIFYYRSDSGSDNIAYHAVQGAITNSGTLTFTMGIAGSNINGHWYLMEDINNNFTVDQQAISFISTNYTYYELSARYNYHQHLIFGSYRYTGGDSNCQHGHARILDNNEDYVYYDRNASSSNMYINAFLMKFNRSEDVYISQRHPGILDTATTSRVVDYQDVAASGTTWAMATPMFCATSTGRTTNGTTSAIYCMAARCEATADNQVTMTRSGTNSSTLYMPHQFIDWSEPTRTGYAVEPKLPTLSGVNSMVRSIEHVSCTLSGSDTNKDTYLYMDLTKGQNVKNCVPFVTYRTSGGGGYPGYLLADFRLLEPNRLRLNRDASSARFDCEIDVVEFEPDQVRVQQGYFITSGTSTTATISGVDLTKAAVRAYNVTNSYASTGAISIYGFVRTRFSASGTLTFERGNSDAMIYGNYYVFEALGDQFSVQSFDTTGSQSWGQYLTTEAPQNRTFLLNSYYMSGTADTNPQHAFWYTQTFPHRWYAQGNKYAAGYTTYHTTYIITLKRNPSYPTNVLTQHFFTEFSNVTTTKNITLRHPVSATSGTVMLINPSPYAGGYFDSGNASYIDAAFVAYKYTDVNTIKLERSLTNSAIIRSSVQAVDFVGYEIPDYTHPAHGSDDLVLSIQHDEFTISGSSYEVDYLKPIPLTKGQNINYCIPFFTYKIDAAVGSRYMSYRPAILIDNGEYHVVKVSGGTEYFSSDIVEFNPARVRIQQGEFHLTNTSGTCNVTISGVSSTANAFLIFYWHPNTTYEHNGTHAVRGRFTSTSGLEFYRNETSYLQSGHWWVVESMAGDFTVDHANITIAGSNYTTVTNKANDLSRTFNLYSYYFNSADTNSQHIGTLGNLASRSPDLRSWVEKSTSGYSPGATMQTITFSEDSGVGIQHRAAAYFQSGVDTTKNFDLATVVNTSRSIAINPNLFGPTYMDTGNTDYNLYGVCRYRINSSGTQVEGSRKGNAILNYSSYFVLEFPENHQYYFSGDVLEQGLPVEREVRVYRRDTGELLNTTMSVSGTGTFYVDTTYSGQHYAVCIDDDPGDVYNALIYDYIVPATIS